MPYTEEAYFSEQLRTPERNESNTGTHAVYPPGYFISYMLMKMKVQESADIK